MRKIGKGENVRFLGVALCRAVPQLEEKHQGAATSIDVEAADNPNLKQTEPDPMLVRRGSFIAFFASCFLASGAMLFGYCSCCVLSFHSLISLRDLKLNILCNFLRIFFVKI